MNQGGIQMKKGKITSLLLAASIALTPASTLAHSGRTDSSGGHRDNKNRSGLGGYHYHHGYGAHLHKNGVCPYSSSAKKNTTTKKKVSTATKEANKKLQNKLNELGYNCSIADGILGAKSKSAIKAFQKDKGLVVDGIAGAKTKAALGL